MEASSRCRAAASPASAAAPALLHRRQPLVARSSPSAHGAAAAAARDHLPCFQIKSLRAAPSFRRTSFLTPLAAAYSSPSPVQPPEPVDPTLLALKASSGTQKTLSFVAFWLQLALTLVSAGVLLFSVFITSSGGPGNLAVDVTKFLTLGGVLLAFISTFFAHGFLRLARNLAEGKTVDPLWLGNSLNTNNAVNLLGIAITTIGLQASVGTLVGKSLMSATTSSLQYNPSASLVSLDVFALQASTNILLCHLIGLTFANLMLRVVRKAMPKGTVAF